MPAAAGSRAADDAEVAERDHAARADVEDAPGVVAATVMA
jgi:hypothetical protein